VNSFFNSLCVALLVLEHIFEIFLILTMLLCNLWGGGIAAEHLLNIRTHTNNNRILKMPQ
jgi:hypothetical protein